MTETEERKKYLIRISYLDSSCLSAATSGEERAAVRGLERRNEECLKPYLEYLSGLGLKQGNDFRVNAQKDLALIVVSLTAPELDAIRKLPNFVGVD